MSFLVVVILLPVAFLALADSAQLPSPRGTSSVPIVQDVRDEFNTSETISTMKKSAWIHKVNHRPTTNELSNLLRQILMQFELDDCCPNWDILNQEVAHAHQIQLEHDQQNKNQQPTGSFYNLGRPRKALTGSNQKRSNDSLKADDLSNELNSIVMNITQLFIDGQSGQTEAEKYYKFLDNVQYYLRLFKVAESYLNQGDDPKHMKTKKTNSSDVMKKDDAFLTKLATEFDLFDSKKSFKRKLEGLRFMISKDPMLSSFIDELTTGDKSKRHSFELYESFIKETNFGQHYARNISMVRDSVRLFDQICQHLAKLNFPSNLTKPSKQYEMIHRMAQRLFQLRHDLAHQIGVKILINRQDTRNLFQQLDELVDSRPEIKMLGDEFGDDNEEEKIYSENVLKLNRILLRYTTNNLTQLTFYNELSELPEEFILFGIQIASDYEIRELPQGNRFNFNLYRSQWSTFNDGFNRGNRPLESDNNSSSLNDARHSTNGFLSNFIG